MKTMRISAAAIAVLLAGAVLPLGSAQDIPMENYADISLGFPYSEDFNADNGGWTASPIPPPEARPDPNSVWEWGAPTSGPGAAFSGSNVWATNLAGNYIARHCGALLSPPIDLSGATGASVSFQQWRHMEESTSSTSFAYDAGRLYVTTDGGATLTLVEPDGGYTSKKISSTSRGCLDGTGDPAYGLSGPAGTTVPAPTYAPVSADLSSFAGDTVQFVIAFASDASIHRQGWYIDDFAVTVDNTTTVEDFESGDGGFSIISTAVPPPPPLGWDWGEAGAGPAANSTLWGTNVAGNYGHKECAWIESPEIDLGPVPNVGVDLITARLTWSNWYRANSLYAAGVVQIGVAGENGTEYTTVTPEGGYGGSVGGTYEDQLVACLGESSTEGAFVGLDDSTGAPLEGMVADITPFVGSTITVRFLFSSAWSTLNPTVYPGWYVDDVEIEQRIVVSGPDVEQIVDDLAGNAEAVQRPGWTTGGEESSWAYGVDANGNLVYATNPLGDHNDSECSWIQSPPIPGAALALGSDLVLNHWWSQYYSTFSGSAWNGGVVMVSTDNGATWSYVASDAYTNVAPFSGVDNCLRAIDPALPEDPMVFGGEHLEVEQSTIDLSAYAGAPTITLRFVQASGISIERPGWNIHGATLGGVPLI